MATITHLGQMYICNTALKGADYIHLLDSDGVMIAAFDGISDFSGFSIKDGDWTTPTPEDECHLAVVKDDGMIGTGSHRCCDIPAALEDLGDVIVCETPPTELVEGKWYLVRAEV